MSTSNSKSNFVKSNFHDMSIGECAAPIYRYKNGDIFEAYVARHIVNAMIIAKAYRKTSPGYAYAILNEGKSVDSAEWVSLALNNPQVLSSALQELSHSFERNVVGAVTSLNESWIKLPESPETYESALEAANRILDIYRLETTVYYVEMTPEIIESICEQLNCRFVLPGMTDYRS